MSLLTGQAIDAEELEKVTSTWPPNRFATLCNTVAWAASGRAFQTFPSFTSRVNVKDGGVDAAWDVEIPPRASPLPTPILGPGWNVFQYKQRDVLARDRQSIISNLRSSLTGTLSAVRKHFDRKPDCYVLFVNAHLSLAEKASVRKSILEGEPEDQSQVEILGAAELAALLNDHPHLRAAFFAPLAFQTWEDAYKAHGDKKCFGSSVDLVGRDSELGQIRTIVDDPVIRAIIVGGPHDMGKSLLALEATKHRPQDVVVALDPRSTSLVDYRTLCRADSEVICIVEDPEFDSIPALIGEALSVSGLKLLITLPVLAGEQDLSYGLDNRIKSMVLEPLNDEEARKLLQATGPIDYGIQDWILSQAGGVPGIILAAASIASNLREVHADFSTTVGRQFEHRIRRELGEAPLQAACLLSTLTYVGTTGPPEAELQAICSIFNKSTEPHEVLSCLPILEKAGLARRAGNFVEISPPLLANHLAEQLFQGRLNQMFALFARLDEAGQIRFIRRLGQLKSQEAARFWDESFAPDGPLGTLDRLLQRPYMPRLVAGTVPDKMLSLFERLLRKTPVEARLAISGHARIELMWALEQLLFRSKTSKGALGLIWLLAEAENEAWSNNASGVLQESFHPLHPQLPLPLEERIGLLRELLSASPIKETRLVAIKAIEGAFKRQRSFHLRHGEGYQPLDKRPDFTWQEVRNYLGKLVEILLSLVDQEEPVSQAATKALPDSIIELAFHGMAAASKKYFQLLTDWALSGREGLDVSRLAQVMSRTRDFYVKTVASADLSEEQKEEYSEFLSLINHWQASLRQAGFSTRLKLWAGGGAYRITADRKQVEEQLQLLAKEAAQAPQLLTPELMQWLLTTSQMEARTFFYALGHEDRALHFQSALELLAKSSLGSRAFAPYFAGWAKRDLASSEDRLDELTALHGVSTTALLETTSLLEPTARGLSRIKQVAPEDPEYASAVLGRWIERLDLETFKELLRIVAGEDLQGTSLAADLLGGWIYHQKPFDDELSRFAWQCIEHGPPQRRPKTAAWHFDELAAKLTEMDPDLGFQKFQQMLVAWAPRSSEWFPLDMDGGPLWWAALKIQDRERLLLTVLQASRMNETAEEVLAWRVKDLLDQEQDADALFKAAGGESENARIAARWLAGSKKNFWLLAFKFLKAFPHDPALQSALISSAMDRGEMIEGPGSQFYERRKQEVHKLLEDPSTPSEIRPWLRDVIESLGSEVSTHLVWEYDREVNDLKRYIRGDDIEQKRWAVARILKYAEWSDVRKLLSVEDIEETLPYIDLPERRRTMIERLLPTWKHAG